MSNCPDSDPATPIFNAVNELMLRIDEINGKSVTDITTADLDILIAYHRRARAKLAAGDKPPRGAPRSKAAIPLTDLLNLAKPAGLIPKPAAISPSNRSGLRRI